MQHQRLVLGQLRQRLTGQDPVLGDQRGARDPYDLVLVGLSNVDQRELLTGVDHFFELLGGDRRGGRRGGSGIADRTTELFVVDQPGDRLGGPGTAGLYWWGAHFPPVVYPQPGPERL